MPSESIPASLSRGAPSLSRGVLQRLAAWSALVIALSGCATIPARDPASGFANCPVCEYNADLACVRVAVRADTPRADWNGTTWYFCSEECRAAFLSDPNRFRPSRGDR